MTYKWNNDGLNYRANDLNTFFAGPGTSEQVNYKVRRKSRNYYVEFVELFKYYAGNINLAQIFWAQYQAPKFVRRLVFRSSMKFYLSNFDDQTTSFLYEPGG